MSNLKRSNAKAQEIIEISIMSRRPSPRQFEVFGDVSDAELRALADDIAANGQREPITVLPNGTILMGHQRVRTLRLLGRATVFAIISHDLVGKSNQANELFVMDNMNRRQLDKISLARCYLVLRDILKGDPLTRQSGPLREAILAKFAAIGCHLTSRSFSRYIRLLSLPRPIQDAVAASRITECDGNAILNQPQRSLEILAKACAAGKSKKELAKLIREMLGRSKEISDINFSGSLGYLAAVAESPSRVNEIKTRYIAESKKKQRLRIVKAMIDDLLNEC